jgi:hypothetical protein
MHPLLVTTDVGPAVLMDYGRHVLPRRLETLAGIDVVPGRVESGQILGPIAGGCGG